MDTMSIRTTDDRRATMRGNERRLRFSSLPVNREAQGIQKATHMPDGADHAVTVYQVFNTEGVVIGASLRLMSLTDWRKLLAL